ncbi:flagellar hook-length control protein FliK [Asticcacaulis sp. 201]|uniref:flagellar hook-length control protein FliK n=1 Tax=Asticcacaulis sp. 201 TaxID=3028787 RepID=UPI002916A4CB|nr:flagellar hook-length control protein FliK [Asticcacaulis sp. 201]MDV6331839.1 flagellar hook-length control protein FliK [Asticcacaulis sp. 201]
MSFDTRALPASVPSAPVAEPRALPDTGYTTARSSTFETMMAAANNVAANQADAETDEATQSGATSSPNASDVPGTETGAGTASTLVTVQTAAESGASDVANAAADPNKTVNLKDNANTGKDGKSSPAMATNGNAPNAATVDTSGKVIAPLVSPVITAALLASQMPPTESQTDGKPVGGDGKAKTDTDGKNTAAAADAAAAQSPLSGVSDSVIVLVTPPQTSVVSTAVQPSTSDKTGDKTGDATTDRTKSAASQLPLANAGQSAMPPEKTPEKNPEKNNAGFAGLLDGGVTDKSQTDKADRTLEALSASMPKTDTAAVASGFSLTTATPTSSQAGYATTQADPAGSLLSQNAVDNLNALSVQINKRLSEGNTKFAMELHPADLGRVDVALTIAKDGQMTAHLSFDTAVTAEVFSQHEADLRHQLAQTGLQLADDALTFSSRVKPVEMSAVTHTNTENRSQDSLSQGGSQQNGSSAQQQAMLNDQQGRQQPNAQHLARALANARQVADAADIDASIDAALANPSRFTSSRLALNLIV